MSIDILMYKVQPINDDELVKISGMNVNDLDSRLGEYQVKAYSLEEMSQNPARFKQIKQYMRDIELLHTTTDYRACCVAHGMPAEITSYSFCHHYGAGITVSFEGGHFRLTAKDLDEFTKTENKTYCVLKRKCIDADVDGWVARALMKALKECDDEENADLSYVPIHLNAQTCNKLCKIIVDLYDQDELYPNAELAKFMLELMRAMCHQDDVFIEFQD